MIVINEELVGKELDANGITSNQQPLKYAKILIKYYQHHGLTNIEIKEKLQERINITCDTNGTIKEFVIDNVCANMNYHGQFRDGVVPISLNELEAIHNLHNINLEKFMFSFLVLCKSFNGSATFAREPFLRFSMLKGTSRDFNKYYSTLTQLGYVSQKEHKFKRRGEEIQERVRILGNNFPPFDESQIVLTIHDTNTPVLYYFMYYDIVKIKFCEKCGCPYIASKYQSRGKDLCDTCRKNNKKEYDKEYKKNKNKNSILKVVEPIR